MQADTFTFFARYIEKELGIVYSDFNKYQLELRLDEVVKRMGLKDVEELRTKTAHTPTPALRQMLLEIATNNETSFFRDPKLFKVLGDAIFPKLADKPLRIWSAACSSGQEPYSIAMVHLESPRAKSLEIVATDVAPNVLKRAEEGRYNALEVGRGLSPSHIDRYFSKGADGFYTAKPTMKSLIQFRPINLLDSLVSLDTFDIVFCRNVLIYQSVENKRRVIEKIIDRLRPGGLLVLGAGESLLGLSEAFTTEKVDNVVYYKLATSTARVA